MPEEKNIVTMRKIDYKCPKCDKGFMRPTGTALMSNPAKYPHKCNNPDCDFQATFLRTYPFIDYI
jgi:transposase-like protein